MNTVIRLGTRGSALARWQTEYVRGLLGEAWSYLTTEMVVISTQGDRVLDVPLPLVGGKGVFTAELEAALNSGEIDLAVHSLKDLPTEISGGLTIGAIPHRADPRDVLVSRQGYRLENLPQGAAVGTSSTRRAAQLRFQRPDLHILDVRGNVDTRLRKALDSTGPYDAIILAHAGLERLGHLDAVTQLLSFEQMLPAPGQGALAVQCRGEENILGLLKPLNHTMTLLAVAAERAFLAALGGGCAVPVAAHADFEQPSVLSLRGRVCAPDGTTQIEVAGRASAVDGPTLEAARQLGADLARRALDQGAAALLNTSTQIG